MTPFAWSCLQRILSGAQGATKSSKWPFFSIFTLPLTGQGLQTMFILNIVCRFMVKNLVP